MSPTDTAGTYVRGTEISARPVTLRSADSRIDTDAVSSVLQYGFVIPPLSPWTDIRRELPPARPEQSALSAADAEADAEQQAAIVVRLLDRILLDSVDDTSTPVVLFSGGVDSGLVAARLRALGRTDTILANYAFGPDDPESHLAEAMARHLGLRFVRFLPRTDSAAILDAPGAVYPVPFADHSAAATADFLGAALEHFADASYRFLDGTGADGAFGMHAKVAAWRRVLRLPLPLRQAASSPYRLVSSLRYRENRLEPALRILRRSARLGVPGAIVAQNPLCGITYSDEARQRLEAMLRAWTGRFAPPSIGMAAVAADMSLVCANIFAQKSRPIFEREGRTVAYPYLDPRIFDLAVSTVSAWGMPVSKQPLKSALAAHVPAELVYREKSGFTDPARNVFFSRPFLDALAGTIEPSGPISELLRPAEVRRVHGILGSGRRPPEQVLNWAWSAVFVDRWYRTASA